jgi:DNA polymerase I-like protein with 3'-5' exonuclease and polymerase domains
VTHVQLKTKIRIDTKIFNPGSRQQVAERLIELGWRPKKFTTNSSAPALDGDVLIGLADEIDHPLVHLLSRYFKIVKYTGMVASWIKYADPQNRVHGKVNTNAAVTGRMTHNTPNLGQIPARDPEFGKRCRNLFMVPGEHTLMGSDAKSLEERMLAHYINIPSYTETVLIDGHSMRRDILEFSPDKAGREKAKTWFYAWLYGGGYPKLGSICFEGIPGMSAQEVKNEGERTARLFESKVPGLKKLKSAIQWYFDKGKRIPGLDGRILEIRAKHSQLNTVLQGGGAVVMKMALIFTDKGLSEALGRNSYGFVVNVHDEFQNELHFTDPEKIEIARSITSDSFMNAGKALGIRCPIEADVKIGKSWAETH